MYIYIYICSGSHIIICIYIYIYILHVHMITYDDDPRVPGLVDFASLEVSNLKPVVAFSAETENILQATLSWDETKLARTNRLVKILGSISSWKNHQDLFVLSPLCSCSYVICSLHWSHRPRQRNVKKDSSLSFGHKVQMYYRGTLKCDTDFLWKTLT